jgi:hypothetical protein
MVIHPGAPLQARRDEFRTPYLDFARQPLPGCLGAWLAGVRLLRPMRAALATATISQTGS